MNSHRREQANKVTTETFTRGENKRERHFRMAALRLALAVFVVMLAVISVTEGMRGSGPKKCCSVFNDKPMQKTRVVSYTKTSQRCANPAIVFTTKAGRYVCARPSAAWVKELIAHLDAKPVPGETSNM